MRKVGLFSLKLLLVCSKSLEIPLFVKRDQEFKPKYLFLMTFLQNFRFMLPCRLLTIFWLFLTNLPLNLEDTTWEDWNYWGVTRLTFTSGRIERTSNENLWSIKASLGPREQIFTAQQQYTSSFPIEIALRNSFQVATAVKPVSPQGLKLLELFLRVSSEGPFTAPSGNLKPSPEMKKT